MHDKYAGLQRMFAVNHGQVVRYLITVRVVGAAVQIADGEADTGNACFRGGELAVPVSSDSKLPNAQGIDVKGRIGARVEVVVPPVIDAKSELVQDVGVKRVDPLRGDVVGVRNTILGKVWINLVCHPVGLVDGESPENFVFASDAVVQASEVLARADYARHCAAHGEIQRIELPEVRLGKVLIDHVLRSRM